MKYILSFLFLLALLPASAHKIRIGEGRGAIVVNNFAATYGFKDGDTVVINHGPGAGVYDYFSFSNSVFKNRLYILASDSGVRFTVCCGGYSSIANCKGLRLEGFKIWRGAFRGIDITGNTDNIYFKNISFRAIKDWGVYFHGLTYNGTEATRNDNITFDHCRFDSMPMGVCLSFSNASRGVTIQYCSFENTYEIPKLGSNTIFFQLIATKVSFHDNTFRHTNLHGVSHNALVYLKGNGRFYNNYSIDRQGDLFRCSPYTEISANSRDRDTLFIYNNRDVSARKYATVELQQFAGDTSANIRPATAYVVGNTGGNFRTADYYPFQARSGGGGSQIDIYTMYTNFHIWNNLAFRCYMDSTPNTNRVPGGYTFNYQFHDGGGSRPPGIGRFGDTSNNLYAHSPAALGITDTLTMHIGANSPARNRGRAALFFKTDYKGTRRPVKGNWDIGAAQSGGK